MREPSKKQTTYLDVERRPKLHSVSTLCFTLQERIHTHSMSFPTVT